MHHLTLECKVWLPASAWCRLAVGSDAGECERTVVVPNVVAERLAHLVVIEQQRMNRLRQRRDDVHDGLATVAAEVILRQPEPRTAVQTLVIHVAERVLNHLNKQHSKVDFSKSQSVL